MAIVTAALAALDNYATNNSFDSKIGYCSLYPGSRRAEKGAGNRAGIWSVFIPSLLPRVDKSRHRYWSRLADILKNPHYSAGPWAKQKAVFPLFASADQQKYIINTLSTLYNEDHNKSNF